MAVTLTLNKVVPDPGGRVTYREWKIRPAVNYTAGATGVAGETLNLTTALNPLGLPRRIPGGTFDINDFAVTKTPSGYDAVLEANAVAPGFTNLVLRLFTSGGTELTGAPTAYPAGLLGQDIVIRHTSQKKNG